MVEKLAEKVAITIELDANKYWDMIQLKALEEMEKVIPHYKLWRIRHRLICSHHLTQLEISLATVNYAQKQMDSNKYIEKNLKGLRLFLDELIDASGDKTK